MKRAIMLCLVIALLFTGCNNAARDQRENETQPSSLTPQVTGEVHGLSETMPPEGATEAANESGIVDPVVILVSRPIETLDPYLTKTVNPEDSVATHIWDTLIWVNTDLALEPRLAETWRLVDDTTWEFRLRQGVTYHNGEPFNAAAVKFSIERAAQLKGGLETFAADVGLQQVEMVDDYTVQLVTAEPDISVPRRLASVEMLPPGHYGSSRDLVASPVGSGPYRFVRQESDGAVTLEANADYWQGPPLLPTLVFRPVADPVTRVRLLLGGQAHLISDLTPDDIATLETENTRVEAVESTRRLFVGIRADADSPMGDKRVRQALNYAVDVDALVNSLAGGYGQRYGSWVNPPHNLNTLTPWPYDPDKARKPLTEAGYPDGFQATLDTPIDHYYQDQAIAYAIAEQLDQVGIQVQVQPYEWSTYVRSRLIPKETSPLFLLSLASWGNGLEDTTNLTLDFPFNPTLWHNAEFESLVAEARATFNDVRLQALLNQAQAIAYEEAPWIWLWRPYDFYGVALWSDWKPRADGLIYLYKANTSG